MSARVCSIRFERHRPVSSRTGLSSVMLPRPASASSRPRSQRSTANAPRSRAPRQWSAHAKPVQLTGVVTMCADHMVRNHPPGYGIVAHSFLPVNTWLPQNASFYIELSINWRRPLYAEEEGSQPDQPSFPAAEIKTCPRKRKSAPQLGDERSTKYPASCTVSTHGRG